MIAKPTQGRKRRFLFYGAVNFLICNSLLQSLLWLGFAVGLSTLVSQSVNIALGFYFYGKKVFAMNSLSSRSAVMYLAWAVLMWLANWSGIDKFSGFGLSRNVSALLMIPILAVSSYIVQKFFIFPATPPASD